MKTIEFMLVHIAIDCLFMYLILKAVYLWICGNVIISSIMPVTILVVFAALGIYNIRSQGLIRSIADVTLGFVMFLFYKSAVANNIDILQSNLWFIVLLRGIIGLAIGLGAFTLFKNFICSYLKAAQIYCIGQKGNAGVIGSLLGALLKFKFTVSIPIFNSIIHNIFSELFDALKGTSAQISDNNKNIPDADVEVGIENNTDSTVAGSMTNSVLDRLQNTPIVRATKGMLKIYINYLDECLLAYCYGHPEKGLWKCSVEAIQLSIIHSVSLLGKIAIIVFINTVMKIVLAICYFIYIVKYIKFQFMYLVLSFIAIKCIYFILQDAVCEPLLMTGILKQFCSYELKEEDEKAVNKEMLEKIIPSFSKLNKFKNSQEA